MKLERGTGHDRGMETALAIHDLPIHGAPMELECGINSNCNAGLLPSQHLESQISANGNPHRFSHKLKRSNFGNGL